MVDCLASEKGEHTKNCQSLQSTKSCRAQDIDIISKRHLIFLSYEVINAMADIAQMIYIRDVVSRDCQSSGLKYK